MLLAFWYEALLIAACPQHLAFSPGSVKSSDRHHDSLPLRGDSRRYGFQSECTCSASVHLSAALVHVPACPSGSASNALNRASADGSSRQSRHVRQTVSEEALSDRILTNLGTVGTFSTKV